MIITGIVQRCSRSIGTYVREGKVTLGKLHTLESTHLIVQEPNSKTSKRETCPDTRQVVEAVY